MAAKKKRRKSAKHLQRARLELLKHNTEVYSLFNDRMRRAQRELAAIAKKLKK